MKSRNLVPAALAATFFFAMAVAPAAESAKPAAAATPASAKPRLTSSDHSFLSDALANNQLDIDVSGYIAKNGSSETVRHFAQQMASEHGRLAAQIQQANDGLVPPPAPTPQPGINLMGRQGADLDRAYAGVMVDYEHDAVGRFKSAVDGPQYSAAIHAMAKKVLPALEHDEAQAQEFKGSLHP